ncbi:MAG: 6-bladed beta-propeller [Castellaniella sp.]
MDAVIVTLGSQRYEVQRAWPGTPHDFTAICDVTVMADGRVVAMRRRAPQLIVLAPSGELLDQWTVPGLVCPHYLNPGPGGGLLIADFDGHQIIALDKHGELRWTLGNPREPHWMAPFNHPTSASMDGAGRLYATDGYGNSCLHIFDAQRTLVRTVGTQGPGPGQFTTPHAVIVLRDGRLLVADRENYRLQFFDAEGRVLGEIGDVYKPMALAELPDATILVTDQTPRLSRFAPDGRLLGRCRTLSTVAHGMAAGADGTIYLAEMTPDMLTRLVSLPA